jgi:hypothetical protein
MKIRSSLWYREFYKKPLETPNLFTLRRPFNSLFICRELDMFNNQITLSLWWFEGGKEEVENGNSDTGST